MATYFDDNGNEITYEQWKANKEKKKLLKKKRLVRLRRLVPLKKLILKVIEIQLKERGNI